MKVTLQWLTILFIDFTPIVAGAEGFLYLPLKDKIILTCDFKCCDFYKACNHKGIDLDTTDDATKVYSATVGNVEKVVSKWQGKEACEQLASYGNHIIIRHPNNYTTLYAHLKYNTIKVKVGDKVSAGQEIATADNTGCSTGSHLHFEVRDPSGKKVNPYGNPPDYEGGCGPNALWATCPPVPYDPSFDDQDNDGYAIAQGDCNDNDPYTNPGVQEFCDDKDNNCNGKTDEQWSVKGTKCVKGKGGCYSEGQWVCATDKKSLFCTAQTIESQSEKCDSKDDDCDGQTDEDWKQGMAQDLGNSCTVGKGECKNQGEMVCAKDGKATVCSVDVLPADCIGKDCGDDGCGGNCGDCKDGYYCDKNKCVYLPCLNNNECLSYQVCDSIGQCVDCEVDNDCPYGYKCDSVTEKCIPLSCQDESCPSLYICEVTKFGICIVDRDCESDWDCWSSEYCTGGEWGQGLCILAAVDCTNNFDCPSSIPSYECIDVKYSCVLTCLPDCNGKQCGPSGCGGVCGICLEGYVCNSGGQCIPS